MKNEIKEILSKDNIHIIECEENWCNAYGYEKSQLKEDLLDYITNLQEKIYTLDKENKYLDNELGIYKNVIDKIKDKIYIKIAREFIEDDYMVNADDLIEIKELLEEVE